MEYSDTLLHDLKYHPRVCSNCLRFLKHEDPLPWLIAERQDALTDPWTTIRENTRRAAPPGDTVQDSYPRNICQCGVVSPYAETHRTRMLDKSTLLSFTKHLSETCRELRDEHLERGDERAASRYAHDRNTLFRCVRHLKSQPEHQRKDDKILASALEVARSRASSTECGVSTGDPNSQWGRSGNTPLPKHLGDD